MEELEIKDAINKIFDRDWEISKYHRIDKLFHVTNFIEDIQMPQQNSK